MMTLFMTFEAFKCETNCRLYIRKKEVSDEEAEDNQSMISDEHLNIGIYINLNYLQLISIDSKKLRLNGAI